VGYPALKTDLKEETMKKPGGDHKMLAKVVLLGIAVFIAAPAFALPPVNTTSEGIAIKGYDPVAYFNVGEPVKGVEGFEYVWNGARWRFSSAEHRDLFIAEPEKYAPQYGGY
jgi:hypothetical protein